jgi:hypothetical protein
MTYAEYRKLLDALVANNQTTGNNHSEAMVNYTKMAIRRMGRLDKTHQVSADLIAIARALQPETWLVISEGWCGDASQTVPLMAKVSAVNPNIQLRLVLRDEHLDLMQEFLTEGAQSIPILIRINAAGEVVGHWGPRPAFAQEMMRAFKASPGEGYAAFSERLHAWYAKDKGASFEQEFLAFLGNP